MKTEKFKINGISCISCKNKITSFFFELEEVDSVIVDMNKKEMVLTYNEVLLSPESIEAHIKDLGYEIDKKNSNGSVINFILAIGIIGVLLYIVNITIGFNYIPEVNQNMSYGMLFIIGLFTSLHCVSMCGGINLSLSIKDCEKGIFKSLKPTLLYNLGRVTSYTMIGGIVGALGSVLSLNGMLKGTMSILAGVFMVVMGVKMFDLFPLLRKLHIKFPRFKIKLSGGPFFVGILNGFMPCGPLQSIQIYALGTGSVLEGALSMFFFSLGTIPLMFLVGAVSSFLSVSFRAKAVKFGGILVLILGIIMINRGLVLSGISVGFVDKNENISIMKDGIQVVESDVFSNEYETIRVKAGVPVKWIINVKEGNLNGCNNPIHIAAYNIKKELNVGENIIEFTPVEDGTFPYSCWMGMIYGTIVVTKD